MRSQIGSPIKCFRGLVTILMLIPVLFLQAIHELRNVLALNEVCVNLEVSLFLHVKMLASIVGQLISLGASCENITQL